MSLDPVPDGDLAAVVTHLEMTAPPRSDVSLESMLRLVRIESPSLDQYRALFRRVGARWLWYSRLAMPDADLAAIIGDPGVELYAVHHGEDAQAGILELDFRPARICELAFVGLVPDHAGQGHGRWLLGEALRLAWREGVERVKVHTCTLDHPAALSAYRRAGFIPVSRAIERFPDPRVLGILPADCAPQLPLLGTAVTGAASPDSWT